MCKYILTTFTTHHNSFSRSIKNVNLKKEFNHYVVLSVPTRFVRDWIVSRYADKILDLIRTFKKSIQRIEFSIDETDEKLDKNPSKTIFTPLPNSKNTTPHIFNKNLESSNEINNFFPIISEALLKNGRNKRG